MVNYELLVEELRKTIEELESENDELRACIGELSDVIYYLKTEIDDIEDEIEPSMIHDVGL